MDCRIHERIYESVYLANMPTPRLINPNFLKGKKSCSRGFTLLEILIALSIFAVVVTTIFGSYNFIFSSTDDFDSGIAVYESARNCLNRMTLDLQAVYVTFPPAYTLPGQDASPDTYRFFGEMETVGGASFSRLRFTSLAHVAFEKSRPEGIAEIVYYVQPGDNGTFILRRSDTLYPYHPFQEKGTDPILCENLKSLRFTYYDPEGDDADHWDSDSDDFKYATPRAVSIQLELGTGSSSQQFATLVTLPVYRLESD
jgi:general secretion pathway protein J